MNKPAHHRVPPPLWAPAWALFALAMVAALGPGLLRICLSQDGLTQDLLAAAEPPGWPHLCGTDVFGRDLLVRSLLGLRMSCAVGLVASIVAVTVGTAVGTLCGYVGGVLDAGLMRLCDVFYTLPLLFVAILLATWLGQGPTTLLVALSAVGWLTPARMVRAQVLADRHLPYVEALQMLGASHMRIVLLHIVPNAWPVVVLAMSLSVPAMVLEEAFLSFLGLGIAPPQASLGTLINDGMDLLRLTPWPLIVPTGAMATLLLLLHGVNKGLGQRR